MGIGKIKHDRTTGFSGSLTQESKVGMSTGDILWQSYMARTIVSYKDIISPLEKMLFQTV